MVYDENRFLSLEEMTVNAQYILDFLLVKGWTKNAICGMLGNMQTESTINFGIWQNLDEGNNDLGFGLVQWTPATKYLDWASNNGYSGDHVSGELNRILYEVENNIQWIATSTHNINFKEFTQSTDSPETLGEAFELNYERHAGDPQPDRKTQARYWYDHLEGGGTTPPTPTPIKGEPLIHMLLSGTMRGWN